MKPTLLFAMLSVVFATPETSAMTELESLRARCSQQEQQIAQLKDENQKLRSGTVTPSTTRSTASQSTQSSSSSNYTIRPGDSLERIARRHGCSLQALLKSNQLKESTVIHPGQKLQIPGAKGSAPAVASIERSSHDAAIGKTHIIKEGETYYSISKKHGVALDTLVAANPNVKATTLRPGQTIRLSATAPATPISTHSQTSNPASAPRSEPIASRAPASSSPEANTASPAAAETPLASRTEKKIRSVAIEGEMTYGEFAAKHGTDTERLNDLNGLDLNTATVLAKGSELYVPAQP